MDIARVKASVEGGRRWHRWRRWRRRWRRWRRWRRQYVAMCRAVAAVVTIGAKGAHRIVRARSTVVAQAVSGVQGRALIGAARSHLAGAAVSAVAAERARGVLCTRAAVVADAVAVVVSSSAAAMVVEVRHETVGHGDIARVKASVEGGRRRQRRYRRRSRRARRQRGRQRHARGRDVPAALWARVHEEHDLLEAETPVVHGGGGCAVERAPPCRLAFVTDPVRARVATVEVVGVVGAPHRRRGHPRWRWRGGRLAGDVCVVAWSVPAGAVAPQDHGLQLDDSIGARELLGAEVDRDVRPDRRPVHRAVRWAPCLRRVGQCVCAVTRRCRGVEGDQAEIVPRVVRPLALPHHPSTQALHQAVAAAPVPAVGAVGAPCTERVGSAEPAVVAISVVSQDALVCAASGCGAGAIRHGKAAAERARNPRGAREGDRRGGRVAGGGRGHVAPHVGEAVVGAAHGVGQDIAAVPVVGPL